MLSKITILGTHCSSCKILIESRLKKLKGVNNVEVDYTTGACKIDFDHAKISLGTIRKTIEDLNYSVNYLDEKKKADKKIDFKKYLLAGLIVVLTGYAYYFVREMGWLNALSALNEKNIGYGLLFGIGVLVSFHCIGMCGGLVVAYTAKLEGKNPSQGRLIGPHLQYNIGRLISYTVIGGILGGVGSFFGISPGFRGAITLAAGAFMLLMGLSLVTDFKWLKKIQIKTPAFVGRFLFNNDAAKKPRGPLIIGLLNGFMPCGPLQAIELYALGTGNFIQGALSMGVFALGTIPVMLGFGSVISIISKDNIKKVMKLSGAVVMLLAVFMFNRGLTNFGIGFTGAGNNITNQNMNISNGNNQEFQEVRMDLTYGGYQPSTLNIKNNIPVRWVIDVKQLSGCTREIIMKDYNIRKTLNIGQNIIEFTPTKTGEIDFSCGMQMVWGKFIVANT